MQEVKADAVEQDGAVGGLLGVESGGLDGGDLPLPVVEGGGFLCDIRGGVILELRVVLVETGGGAGGGLEVEVDLVEVLVGEEVEGLGGAIGGGALGGGGESKQGKESESGEPGAHGGSLLRTAART